MVCQIGGLLLMKNKLYKYKDTIVRVLKESDQSVFTISGEQRRKHYDSGIYRPEAEHDRRTLPETAISDIIRNKGSWHSERLVSSAGQ